MLTTFTVQLELRLLVNEADDLTRSLAALVCVDAIATAGVPLASVTQSSETVTVVFPNTVRCYDGPATSFILYSIYL